MSDTYIRKCYEIKVGNSHAKSLFARLAYNCECSINQLSVECELSKNEVETALYYLIENDFIRPREGMEPGYTDDKNDDIYQYMLPLEFQQEKQGLLHISSRGVNDMIDC